MSRTEKNARFWFCANEWTKITLRKGQTLTYVTGGATDEGYSVAEWKFYFDGQFVTIETSYDARDCDGRVSQFGEIECPVDMLKADFNDYAQLPVPDWHTAGTSYRDYSAEAAGY